MSAMTMTIALVLGGLAAALALQLHRKTRELRREALYRNVFERAPEAILVYDTARQRIVEHNDKVEQLFGRDRQALHAATLAELFADPDQSSGALAASIAETTRRVLAGESIIVERPILRPDGGRVVCEVWLTCLPEGVDGRPGAL
ncbi:MAG TPA: PAS domain S-box protein, partial [Telluria sp.]